MLKSSKKTSIISCIRLPISVDTFESHLRDKIPSKLDQKPVLFQSLFLFSIVRIYSAWTRRISFVTSQSELSAHIQLALQFALTSFFFYDKWKPWALCKTIRIFIFVLFRVSFLVRSYFVRKYKNTLPTRISKTLRLWGAHARLVSFALWFLYNRAHIFRLLLKISV